MPLVGTAQYRNLIPWLRTHMKSNEGSIERSGAAQGLAYVAGAVVDADHGQLLRQAIEWSCVDGRNRNASVREGALCLFVFLPSVVGDRLAPSLADVLEPVLTGFADENDLVRDTAQRAAKALMTQFTSNQHTLNTTLLPALEQGLFNDEWRVRSATVSLMSEMLHMLAEQTDDSEADGKSGGGRRAGGRRRCWGRRRGRRRGRRGRARPLRTSRRRKRRRSRLWRRCAR
jgi:hypothetical protein